MTQRLTLGQAIEESVPTIEVHGIRCPRCTTEKFTQARSIEPFNLLDQELKAASRLNQDNEIQPFLTTRYVDRPMRSSASSKSLHSTSSRSLLRPIQNAKSHHSRKGSSDNTSQSSSKGKSSNKFGPGSSTLNVHVSYAMFTDGRFVLAFTSSRISCYDCELKSWSRGHSFAKIIMAAGSSVRYAVLSQETHVSLQRPNSIREIVT